MKKGYSFQVSLGVNPPIPLLRAVNVSTSLVITKDGYTSGNSIGETIGMVGVGGTHVWDVKAVQAGNQTFRADLVRLNARPDETTVVRSYQIIYHRSGPVKGV